MNIAIMLMAGYGSRFKDLTINNHKCLLWVNNKKIIDYQLESLINSNVDQIYCVVGHEKEKIIEYVNCKYAKSFNINFIVNEDYLVTNNMYSLYLALEKIKNSEIKIKNVVIMNGDIVFEKSLINDILEKPDNLIVCKPDMFLEESMKIVVTDGLVKKISKQINKDDSYACSIDLYKFTDEHIQKLYLYIFGYIQKCKTDWSEIAINNTLHMSNVYPYSYNGKWYEIDNVEDIITANNLFNIQNKLLNFNVVNKYDTFVFDLDGVIYKDNKLIDVNIPIFINKLIELGKRVIYVSNNSSNSPSNYAKKLNSMNINTTNATLITSLTTTLQYLKDNLFTKIHVFGNDIAKLFFQTNGFILTNEDPDIVVLCYDNDLTYEKYKIAIKLISSGVNYIATHSDMKYPIDDYYLPDIGCMINTIIQTTNIQPKIILGKSSEYVAKYLSSYVGENICVFGDNINTDHILAQNLKCDFVLVMTGVSNVNDIEYVDKYVPFLHYCHYLKDCKQL